MVDQELWHFIKGSEPKIDITVCGIDSAKDLVKLIQESEYNLWVVSCDTFPVPIGLDKSVFVMQPPAASVAGEKEVLPPGAERRKHKRISASLNLLITNRDKTFYAVSVNISMGGVKLKSALPANFLNQPCKVTILSPISNMKLSFTASIIESKENGSRLMFGEMSDEAKKELENFIEGKPFVPKEDH